MAFKYAIEEERRDYLLLPLPLKDFNEGSKAFPFEDIELEGSQFPVGTIPWPNLMQLGNANYANPIEALGMVLYKLVGSAQGESPNRTLFLSGYLGTAGAIGSAYRIGLSLREEDPGTVSAVLGDLYELLRPITGPTAIREVRSQLLQKLSGMAEAAAPWLVQRLRSEQDIDAQEAALSALSEIGQSAFPPVVAELTRLVGTDDADHATLFLRAFRGFQGIELGPWVHIVLASLPRFHRRSTPRSGRLRTAPRYSYLRRRL